MFHVKQLGSVEADVGVYGERGPTARLSLRVRMDVLVRFVNAALMIGLPLGLGIFLARALRPGWRLFFVGAATFLGSQILHIPFNAWALSPLLARLGIVQSGPGLGSIVAAVALGLSAGVFEEVARYVVLRTWLRDARSWGQAVMFGAGHGGMEAVALGVIALVALFQGIAYRNADLSALVPPDRLGAAQAQIEAYWAAPASLVMLGSVERGIALCVQVSLAVVVLQAVVRRNPAWLGLAIGWHALVDASAVAAVGSWGPYWTEAMLAAMGVVSLVVLFRLRQADKHEGPPSSGPAHASADQRPPAPPSIQAVDDSRFID
jgi:uncharacterized membrane protein YhfC